MMHRPLLIRVVILLGALTLLIGIGFGLWPDRLSGSVLVEPASIDVEGDGQGASNRVVRLSVINECRETVTIQKVSASCGCTVTGPVEQAKLLPGQSTSVPVTLTIPSHGERSSLVTLEVHKEVSKSTERFQIPVQMRGGKRHLPYVIDVPSRIDSRIASMDAEVHREFEFATMEEAGSADWLQSPVSSNPLLNVSVMRVIEPGERNAAGPRPEKRIYKCQLSARIPEGPDARVASEVRLAVDGPRLFVVLSRELPIKAMPSELLIPLSSDDSDSEKSVTLIGPADAAFQIANVTSDVPWLKVSYERVSDRCHLMKVKANREQLPPESKFASGTINVTTGNPDGLTIRLPVTVSSL